MNATTPQPREQRAELAAIRDLLAEWRRLYAAATPGPFAVASGSGVFANLQSLHRLVPGKDGWRQRVATNMLRADAALYARMLNDLPALIAAVDALEADR